MCFGVPTVLFATTLWKNAKLSHPITAGRRSLGLEAAREEKANTLFGFSRPLKVRYWSQPIYPEFLCKRVGAFLASKSVSLWAAPWQLLSVWRLVSSYAQLADL